LSLPWERSSLKVATPPTTAFETAEHALADMEAVYGERGIDRVLRGLDLAIAGSILAVCSPMIAVIAILIRATSGAPVLYRGARVGQGGAVFEMLKFRTLRRGAEDRLGSAYGPELSARTEREVTAVGRVLRATHVDELPQLWNVLRGEMSMVGPRPMRPLFLAELTGEMPQYAQRLVVRPGVTGFAQTRITREESWSDKLAHDLEYIADRSVTLYLQVLAATALRVARRTVGAET
jgi:lipopolysaccharide/colanic/teichoic acid biosynthesis glycosyltransferase